jgi:hypothetical protein
LVVKRARKDRLVAKAVIGHVLPFLVAFAFMVLTGLASKLVLKLFGWGIKGTPSVTCRDDGAISSPPAP